MITRKVNESELPKKSNILNGLVSFQIIILSVCAIILGKILGLYAFIAVWLGGLSSVIPGLLMAKLALSSQLKPKQILGRFYLGEALKLILTAVLFTISLQWSKLNGEGLLLGFISAELAYLWLILKFKR